MPNFITWGIGGIIGAILGVLVCAILLRFATQIVAKFDLPAKKACLAVTAVIVLNAVIWLIAVMIDRVCAYPNSPDPDVHYTLLVVVPIIQVIVASFIYGRMLVHPTAGRIGFKKGLIVSLFIIGVSAVITLALYIPFKIFFFA